MSRWPCRLLLIALVACLVAHAAGAADAEPAVVHRTPVIVSRDARKTFEDLDGNALPETHPDVVETRASIAARAAPRDVRVHVADKSDMAVTRNHGETVEDMSGAALPDAHPTVVAMRTTIAVNDAYAVLREADAALASEDAARRAQQEAARSSAGDGPCKLFGAGPTPLVVDGRFGVAAIDACGRARRVSLWALARAIMRKMIA